MHGDNHHKLTVKSITIICKLNEIVINVFTVPIIHPGVHLDQIHGQSHLQS